MMMIYVIGRCISLHSFFFLFLFCPIITRLFYLFFFFYQFIFLSFSSSFPASPSSYLLPFCFPRIIIFFIFFPPLPPHPLSSSSSSFLFPLPLSFPPYCYYHILANDTFRDKYTKISGRFCSELSQNSKQITSSH